MNNKNTDRDEGWDYCDRCGMAYSLSYFTQQRGLMVCTECRDDDIGLSENGTIAPISDERIIT